MSLEVFALNESHRTAWQPLAEGYKEFYKTVTSKDEYEVAWCKLMSGTEVHGLGASADGEMVGFAHYLFHTSTWAPKICYLQDMFTAPHARGRGIARELIREVADRARAAGAVRYYWLTQESNAVARVLYDRVAKFNGFIRYDYSLNDA